MSVSRRALAVVLLLALIAGAFAAPAEAKKKKKKKNQKIERTATGTYQLPAIGALGAGVCSPGTIGCIDFPSTTGELFVTVEVADMAGPSVFASVTQDLDGDNQADETTDICGTGGPIPISEGYGVTVFIWEGPGLTSEGEPCAGVASSGEIKATFSNRP